MLFFRDQGGKDNLKMAFSLPYTTYQPLPVTFVVALILYASTLISPILNKILHVLTIGPPPANIWV